MILKRINQEHVNIVKSQEHDKSLKSINEVTNAQHRHQKVFVETYHNILSFHAAEDQQQTPGGCPSDHNTTCLFFFIDIWQNIFFFVNVDIVLVCRRPRQLPPMSVQIFTSNLEPVNPSLDKITKRYVLKPNILIIAYYYSKLQRTDSKCLADARVCRITIRSVLFLFIDRWQ